MSELTVATLPRGLGPQTAQSGHGDCAPWSTPSTVGWRSAPTYQIARTQVGGSDGETRRDKTANDNDLLMQRQYKATVGRYHNLTDSQTLIGEYARFAAENHQGDELVNGSLNLGVALCF